MQWTAPTVDAMLALRVSVDTNRWDQQWQDRQGLSLKQQHQRTLDRQSRQQQALESLKPFVVRFLLLQARCFLAKRALPGAVAPVAVAEEVANHPVAPLVPARCRSAFNPWRGDPSKAFVKSWLGKWGSYI